MKQRQIYLDNIKVLLIAYVITGHIAASYGAIGGGRWNYLEAVDDFTTRAALTLFVLPAYAFLMGMFIFIAGYFTYPSVAHKGPRTFMTERLVRLGIPLLLYYFLLGPVVRYVSKTARGYDGSFLQFLSESYHSGVYGFMGVMWFVVLILGFSLAYAVFFMRFPEGWIKPKNERFPSFRNVLIFVTAISLLSFAARILFPMGGDFAGSRPLGSIVFFAASFFLGTTAARFDWVEKMQYTDARPWFLTAVAVMLIPAIWLLASHKTISIDLVARPGSLASLLYAFWEVVKTLGTGMIAVIAFRKWLNTPGKWAEAIGKSTFLAYFLHPLICVCLLGFFADSGLHPLVKFCIVAPSALILTFTAAILLRRIPGVSRVL
jgi:glucans biosynthesis protein C